MTDTSALALSEWYEAHALELIRFAASLVGWYEAEDMVSQAVTATLAQPQTSIRALDAYLYTVVLNCARRRWRVLSREADFARSFQIPANVAESEPTDRSIARAIADLSVRQRAAIYLTYWADLTPEAIACKLGISEGSVRRHLARGRKRLRETIDGEH